jgi:hypothetical protein
MFDLLAILGTPGFIHCPHLDPMIINDPIFRTTRHPHSAKRHWSLSSTERISELEPLNPTCQIIAWIDVARHDVCTRNCGFTWPWLYHSCFHIVSLVSYTFMFMAYPVLDVRFNRSQKKLAAAFILPKGILPCIGDISTRHS